MINTSIPCDWLCSTTVISLSFVDVADTALVYVRLTLRACAPNSLCSSFASWPTPRVLLICAVEERRRFNRWKSKESKGLGRKLFFVFERAFGLNDSPSTSSPLPLLQLSSWPQGPLGHQHCNSIQVKHAQLLFPFWGKGKITPPPLKRLCLTSISLSKWKGGTGLCRPCLYLFSGSFVIHCRGCVLETVSAKMLFI